MLDLTKMGIDFDPTQIDCRLPRRQPPSGETYDWAEREWPTLSRHYAGVILMQWHVDYSGDPERTLLIRKRNIVTCSQESGSVVDRWWARR